MKKIFRKEVIIGLCVVVALFILFYGIEFLKGVNVFRPHNNYYVVYEDVAGLKSAAPVTVNGYQVGQVMSVKYMYNNPGHVLVEMSLDKEMKLPLHTTADIEVSLLGTASIILNMTSDSEYYHAGDTITGAVKPGMLDGLQTDVMPNVGKIATNVDSLLLSLNALISDPALSNTIKNLETFSTSLNQTMNGVKAASSTLPGVMKEVDEIAAQLTEISKNINVLSSELANAPVDSIIDNLNRMSAQLAEVSEKLNNPDSSIGKLLNDEGLYNNINSTISDLDSLFIDIKKNPKRYINIKLL